MPKHRLKLMIAMVLLIVLMTFTAMITSGLGELVALFSKGADPATALNIVPNVPPDVKAPLKWRPDRGDTGREMEPITRTQITASYQRAWLQWNWTYRLGNTQGLRTYFSASAAEALEAALADTLDQKLRIEQADLGHDLQLHLYSADGSIVSFTDYDVGVAQAIRDETGQILYVGETRADYDVVMFLEDGNWRVRHWVRRAATASPAPIRAPPCVACVKAHPHPFAPFLSLNGEEYIIRGMNYYPQQSPWHRFWIDYDPAIIDQDMAIIRGLGLNTIRIFVQYDVFGGADVQPRMLNRLADVLDRAQAHQLRVVITLFDFRVAYGPADWPDTARHIEQIVPRFAEHPAILAWDVKNEPDMDDDVAGAALVDAWLEYSLGLIRRYDHNHLLTIGWSRPDAAQRVANHVDLIQFHYYGAPAQLSPAIATLQSQTSAPVFVGEFGLPTWNTVFPHGHTADEQATYYAAVRQALSHHSNVGYMAWTLYDFTEVPPDVAGRWPWQTGPQRHMGVLRVDGEPKPAASLLAQGANLDVAELLWWARFTKPFWITLLTTVVTIIIIAYWWVRKLLKTNQIST